MESEAIREIIVSRSYRLPESAWRRLKAAAAHNGQSIQETLLEAIDRHVKELESARQAAGADR